jgi:hypothetical protein
MTPKTTTQPITASASAKVWLLRDTIVFGADLPK